MKVITKLKSSFENIKILINTSRVYFGQCIQAALMYRSSLLVFVCSEAFAYAGFISFWYMAASSSKQAFYSPISLVVYFALASYFHGIQHHAAARDLGGEIRQGKLSYSIIRPFPFLLQASLKSMAYTLTYSLLLLPLLLAAFAWVPGMWETFSVQMNSGLLAKLPLALFLGLAAGWMVRILVGMLAFDMAQIWGPDTFFISLYFLASGNVYPIDLLPSWAIQIASWTPMYYMVGFPVLTCMGRISEPIFWQQAQQGIIVLGVMLVIMKLMWSRGLKQFEAIGI